VELLPLLLGHLEVADLFPAEDHAVGLATDFSDDAKGAMACEGMCQTGLNRKAGQRKAYQFFPAPRTCRFRTWWQRSKCSWEGVGVSISDGELHKQTLAGGQVVLLLLRLVFRRDGWLLKGCNW
jgi:hypothetical protein